MNTKADFTKPVDFKELAATFKKAHEGKARPSAVWIDGILYLLKKGKYRRADSLQ